MFEMSFSIYTPLPSETSRTVQSIIFQCFNIELCCYLKTAFYKQLQIKTSIIHLPLDKEKMVYNILVYQVIVLGLSIPCPLTHILIQARWRHQLCYSIAEVNSWNSATFCQQRQELQMTSVTWLQMSVKVQISKKAALNYLGLTCFLDKRVLVSDTCRDIKMTSINSLRYFRTRKIDILKRRYTLDRSNLDYKVYHPQKQTDRHTHTHTHAYTHTHIHTEIQIMFNL